MTGYVRKLEDNTTMSFKISNKHLLKKYNQIWKRVAKLLKMELDSEPVYGDSDKYIKTRIKILLINNNARFCYQSKEKVLSSNTFLEECKYEQEKTKIENLTDDDLEKSLSNESDCESDHDKDNDECKEYFVKR